MRVELQVRHCGAMLLFSSIVIATGCTREGGSHSTSDAGTPAQASSPLSARMPASAAARSLEALPEPAAKTREQCATICARSRELQCKSAAECLPNCLAMASVTPCREPMTAFYDCLVGQPVSHWRCDRESGVAQIREGFCEDEQRKTVSCMEAKMTP